MSVTYSSWYSAPPLYTHSGISVFPKEIATRHAYYGTSPYAGATGTYATPVTLTQVDTSSPWDLYNASQTIRMTNAFSGGNIVRRDALVVYNLPPMPPTKWSAFPNGPSLTLNPDLVEIEFSSSPVSTTVLYCVFHTSSGAAKIQDVSQEVFSGIPQTPMGTTLLSVANGDSSAFTLPISAQPGSTLKLQCYLESSMSGYVTYEDRMISLYPRYQIQYSSYRYKYTSYDSASGQVGLGPPTGTPTYNGNQQSTRFSL